MTIDKDWNSERWITALELADSPKWFSGWFYGQSNVWRPHPGNADVLVNMAHPDNRELAAIDLINACR